MSDMTVPGISDVDPTSDKPVAPVPKAFPGHVQVDDVKTPEDWKTGRDFIPSVGRKAQILEYRGLKARQGKGIGPMPVRKLHGIDHMSYEDSQKVVRKKGSLIKKMATEMLKDREDDIRRYSIAKQIVAKSTISERKKATGKLHKALSILEKGPPITHEEALKSARDKVFREHM